MSGPHINNADSASESAQADIEQAIAKLKGNDRVGTAGQVSGIVAGAAGGAAAAGAAAAAAGASTILGSTTLGSVLGGVFVASTPVGWIVGCAAVGAAGAYGISRIIRSGGKNDRLREEVRARLSERLRQAKTQGDELQILKELASTLARAIDSGVLSIEQADRMTALVGTGKLDARLALARAQSLLVTEDGRPQDSSVDSTDALNSVAEKISAAKVEMVASVRSATNVVSERAESFGKVLGNSAQKWGAVFKSMTKK